MIVRMIVMLLVVGALAGGIYEFKSFVSGKIRESLAGLATQPQTVSTAEASVQDWQPHLRSVGTLRAENGADLSPQVAGIVSALHFESGADVTKGTLLIELQAADDIAKLRARAATDTTAAA